MNEKPIRRLGLDILSLDRLSRSMSTLGPRFVEKFARASEIEAIAHQAPAVRENLFAQLFCAKEALFKVLDGVQKNWPPEKRFWLKNLPCELKSDRWQPDNAALREMIPDLSALFLDIKTEAGRVMAVALGEFAA